MRKSKDFILITNLTAFVLALTSYLAVFYKDAYIKECLSYASQGRGQDIFDLIFVVPFIIVAAYFMKKGNKLMEYLWVGAMIYILYSYVIYSFAVHFNYLFLFYCIILGFSFYSLVYYFFDKQKEEQIVIEKLSVLTIVTACFLIFIAVIFGFLWLSDVIPAIVNGSIPKGVAENNFFTNPIHVLDLAIVLPACVMTSAMLLKRKSIGYILAPALLSFCIFMLMALVAMVIGMKMAGVVGDISIVWIFSVLGSISGVLFYLFIKEKKNEL